jgi:heme/copper-type cytochrome/quinol oxidase subunit 2
MAQVQGRYTLSLLTALPRHSPHCVAYSASVHEPRTRQLIIIIIILIFPILILITLLLIIIIVAIETEAAVPDGEASCRIEET